MHHSSYKEGAEQINSGEGLNHVKNILGSSQNMFLTIYLYCFSIWYHLFMDHWQTLRSCLKWRKEKSGMTFRTVRVRHVFCIYLYVASLHSINWSEKISADDPEDQNQISHSCELVPHDPLSEARARGSDIPALQIEASLPIALTYCTLVCIRAASVHIIWIPVQGI